MRVVLHLINTYVDLIPGRPFRHRITVSFSALQRKQPITWYLHLEYLNHLMCQAKNSFPFSRQMAVSAFNINTPHFRGWLQGTGPCSVAGIQGKQSLREYLAALLQPADIPTVRYRITFPHSLPARYNSQRRFGVIDACDL